MLSSRRRALLKQRERAQGPGLELGLELEELTIDPSSVYVGQGLHSSGIRQDLGITVLAIKREGEEMKYSPTADAVLCAGDHLIVMGDPVELRKLEVLAGVRK